MRNPELLTIGKVADRGGVKVQTIRYYERRGLLPKPARSASGYRKYSDEAIRRQIRAYCALDRARPVAAFNR